jgi:hypothetical protein
MRTQIDVMGHQTVAEQSQSGLSCTIAERTQIVAAIVVGEENILAITASLGEVVRAPHRNHAGFASHWVRVWFGFRINDSPNDRMSWPYCGPVPHCSHCCRG